MPADTTKPDEKGRKRSAALAGLLQGLIGGIVAPIAVGALLLVFTPWAQDQISEPTCDAPRGLQLIEPTGQSSSEPFYTERLTGVEYGAALAVDGDTGTAWVEGVDDPANPYGTGSWIELALPAGTDVQMLCLVNGYAKSDDTFLQNARVRQWKVETDAGSRVSVLPDKSVDRLTDYQSLDIDEGVTSKVILTMETFRAPTGAIRYTDTALSEIEVWAN